MGKGSLRYSSEAAMPESMRALLAQQATQVPQERTAPAAAPKRHHAHAPGEMNKTEQRYAQELLARTAAGEVTWWAFEVLKLRLATGTWLTVDFAVLLADGTLELVDVKGRTSGDRFWAEEDAKVKLKVAAELVPFPVVVAWPAKGGGWHRRVLPRRVP